MQMVRILGGYQTDFARNLQREGAGLEDLTREVVCGTLEDAGIGPEEVQTIHVGNAFGQLYTGQGHLGAMPSTVVPELWGVPAMRHEAACASASLAVLAAMAEIEAGRYDCALVIGVEQEKTLPGAQAAEVQFAAARVSCEERSPNIWPSVFDALAEEYDRRYGLDEAHLHAIGSINLHNAKANPKAQTRDWELSERSFALDDDMNPRIVGRVRRNDCCQITDGAAGVVLVSERWLAEHGDRRAQSRIRGWGHRTVGLDLAGKLERSADDPFVLPHVRGAIEDAFLRAGIRGVSDLDLIETHDCMTPSEYMAIDHFGITAPGESWKAVEEGWLERGGRLPVNPSGGLMGVGHPVGATGVRMLVDATHQVTDCAGATQVEGAERAATLNIGGSTATTVSFVVEAEQP